MCLSLTNVGLKLLETVDEIGVDIIGGLLLARRNRQLNAGMIVGHNVQIPSEEER
jgi:hypothetical protein